jgi:hypothetical protein
MPIGKKPLQHRLRVLPGDRPHRGDHISSKYKMEEPK